MVVRYGGFKYLAERYQYRTGITQYFDYDADQQLAAYDSPAART